MILLLRKDLKYLLLLNEPVIGPNLTRTNVVFGTVKESNQFCLTIGQLAIHPDNVISAYQCNTIPVNNMQAEKILYVDRLEN